KIEAAVSYPHLPENTHTIQEAIKDNIKVNQVVIGSCTNGRLEDIKMAAQILKGRKVHPDTRVLIFPATQDIVLKSIELGYYQALIEAGCAISTPTCGPCLGGHCGILAPDEVCVSTTNRNFVGRMGHTDSKIYLASPYVAAASAVLGRIGSPEEL
ncbi:3-isopropylmalate dehydratase large subunit, partial [bacterium]|nr:3-isopropylmalate dehydratase large subunit [bacterium]